MNVDFLTYSVAFHTAVAVASLPIVFKLHGESNFIKSHLDELDEYRTRLLRGVVTSLAAEVWAPTTEAIGVVRMYDADGERVKAPATPPESFRNAVWAFVKSHAREMSDLHLLDGSDLRLQQQLRRLRLLSVSILVVSGVYALMATVLMFAQIPPSPVVQIAVFGVALFQLLWSGWCLVLTSCAVNTSDRLGRKYAELL